MGERNAIVIGASSGIGRETARMLALSGRYSRVGITARRKELLEETASRAPEKFLVKAFDLSGEDAVEQLVGLTAELGNVSLILFCSGTGDINEGLDESIELRTNVLNVDAFTRIAVFAYNYLASSGGGIFAAVTSVMGLRGSRSAPAYAASKAYQINYLEGLRQKARKGNSGVAVLDIRPGSVQTDMMKGDGHFWIASPARAARVIMRAIERRKKICYVTPRWRVVAWLLANMPLALYERI